MNDTEIEAAGRDRLHEALLMELAERGHHGIRLEIVLERAGVSEEDFAATYGGIDSCLFEAYGSLTDHLDRLVRAACRAVGPGEDWAAHIRAGLSALLAELARDPVRAAVLVRDFPAIGQRAQARFQAFVESFAPLLEGGRAAGKNVELPGEVETLAVGAAEALVFEEIVAGRAGGLSALEGEILFSLLVPFIGPSRAADEMRRSGS
ncbi:MAG TPA: hypothetical protein VMH33_04625 [Solirubrobacterales bacterium]|nr:hypothetical protein [Solirubrobacterales bacterium]